MAAMYVENIVHLGDWLVYVLSLIQCFLAHWL